MKAFRLQDMTKGWFVGDFNPVALRTQAAEIAVKTYPAGTLEPRHVHKVAPEVTLILSGSALINGQRFEAGSIVVIEPGEATEFEAVTEVTTVVVKVPSVAGDKYLC